MREHFPLNVQEPPEDGIIRWYIAIAACHDCEQIIGPSHADDVSQGLHQRHSEHDTEFIAAWTEVSVFDDRFFEYAQET